MKTLIIGDIHNNWKVAENIIQQIAHDKTVFVGDYFDSWNDSEAMSKETALWLKYSLEDPSRTHLIGNHDIPYIKHSRWTDCPGYTPLKSLFINEVLSVDDWKKLKFFSVVDNKWLVSHSGLHVNHIVTKFSVSSSLNLLDLERWLERETEKAWKDLMDGTFHWFFSKGQYRSDKDNSLYGGLLWQDWTVEFQGIPDINQIVGHTYDIQYPRIRRWDAMGSVNYCVDCMPNEVLLIEDGKEEIIRV